MSSSQSICGPTRDRRRENSEDHTQPVTISTKAKEGTSRGIQTRRKAQGIGHRMSCPSGPGSFREDSVDTGRPPPCSQYPGSPSFHNLARKQISWLFRLQWSCLRPFVLGVWTDAPITLYLALLGEK